MKYLRLLLELVVVVVVVGKIGLYQVIYEEPPGAKVEQAACVSFNFEQNKHGSYAMSFFLLVLASLSFCYICTGLLLPSGVAFWENL